MSNDNLPLVNGCELLDKMTDTYKRFVYLLPGSHEILGAWSLATYTYQQADIFPRGRAVTPRWSGGKTVLSHLVTGMSFMAKRYDSASKASLFRAIDAVPGTRVLDEIDTYLDEDYRNLMNSGYHKEGTMLLCDGDKHEPREFSSYCPLFLLGIDHLDEKAFGPLISRCIEFRMDKAPLGARSERFRPRQHKAVLSDLSKIAQLWSDQNHNELTDPDPMMPPELDYRPQDNWRHIFAVCDLAGGGTGR